MPSSPRKARLMACLPPSEARRRGSVTGSIPYSCQPQLGACPGGKLKHCVPSLLVFTAFQIPLGSQENRPRGPASRERSTSPIPKERLRLVPEPPTMQRCRERPEGPAGRTWRAGCHERQCEEGAAGPAAGAAAAPAKGLAPVWSNQSVWMVHHLTSHLSPSGLSPSKRD